MKNQAAFSRNNSKGKEKKEEGVWESEEEEVVAEDGGWESDESDAGGNEELSPVPEASGTSGAPPPRLMRKAKTKGQARLLQVLATETEGALLPQKRKQALPEYNNIATKKTRGT